MSDSPNPVERYEVTGNPKTGQPEMVPSPNPLGGGYVRYSDYQAEVEKREEVERRLEDLVMAEQDRASMAESKLSSAEAELKRTIALKTRMRDAPLPRFMGELAATASYNRLDGELRGQRDALRLLRDKGTEQGGATCEMCEERKPDVESVPTEDGDTTELCLRCRLIAREEELKDLRALHLAPARKPFEEGCPPETTLDDLHRPARYRQQEQPGVSIEGGLEELLGWVEGLRLRKQLASEDEGARREFRAADRGAANALEDVARHIRERLPQQSTTGKHFEVECPDAEVCQRCPAADEDDVCLVHERRAFEGTQSESSRAASQSKPSTTLLTTTPTTSTPSQNPSDAATSQFTPPTIELEDDASTTGKEDCGGTGEVFPHPPDERDGYVQAEQCPGCAECPEPKGGPDA